MPEGNSDFRFGHNDRADRAQPRRRARLYRASGQDETRDTVCGSEKFQANLSTTGVAILGAGSRCASPPIISYRSGSVPSSRRTAPEYPLGRLPRSRPYRRTVARTPRRRTLRASRHAGRQSDGSLRWVASYPALCAAAPYPATIQTAEGVDDAEFEARREHRALHESAVGLRDVDRRPRLRRTRRRRRRRFARSESSPRRLPWQPRAGRRRRPSFRDVSCLVRVCAPGIRRRPERQAWEGAIGGSRSGAWRISGRGRHLATNRFGGFPASSGSHYGGGRALPGSAPALADAGASRQHLRRALRARAGETPALPGAAATDPPHYSRPK